MISLVTFLTGLFTGLCIAFRREIKELQKNIQQLSLEQEPTVTESAKEFSRENYSGQDSSRIIEPLTPQQVAYNEEEAIRKANLRVGR